MAMTHAISQLGGVLCLAAAGCLSGNGLLAAEPLPPAAAPGSPAIYLTHQQLSDVLKASIAKGAAPALSQIASTDQYFINEVHRTKVGAAVTHPGWTELHIILAGSATLVTGGEIKASGGTKVIEGGVSRKVAKGDVILVPADTPHWYQAIDGSLDAIEVRFIRPDAAKNSP
jgi:mannose-6-phosphate isomerase-like protein (cupin superfamily)